VEVLMAEGLLARFAQKQPGRIYSGIFPFSRPDTDYMSGPEQPQKYAFAPRIDFAAGIPGNVLRALDIAGRATSGEMVTPRQANEVAMTMMGGSAFGRAPAGALATGLMTRGAGNPPNPTRISTRNPTGVKRTEDPVAEQLSVGLAESKASPGYEHNVGLLAQYPGFRRLQGRSTDEIVEGYIGQTQDNLRRIYDEVPTDTRERSKLWYEGANRFSDAKAEEYSLERPTVSAVIAALSPQKDWFQNASLAERLIDTSMRKGNLSMTRDMAEYFQRTATLNKPEYRGVFESIKGVPLSRISNPTERALWIRLYDEAHNDKAYRIITPEGDLGDFVTKADGIPAKAGWGSLSEIAKGVSALLAGNDRAALSDILGERHKIRSFYNNIENPRLAEYGDVTIDTHAVAAQQMRPFSGKSLEVAHNFKNSILASDRAAGAEAAKGSALTGVQGTYGINADAYQRAASDVGKLPREMQSITWEAIRGLFPANFKNAKNSAMIDDIWRSFDAGEITLRQAQDAVLRAAGGIDPPSWGGRATGLLDPKRASTFVGGIR
jgi:hypothetical protein